MSKKTTVSFPLFGILGLILITLKLAAIGVVANWSWGWVLLPFYGPLVFVIGCLAITAIVFAVCK